ncbi:MAG TPA: DUF808 domain-containing protein [Propioniciclava sp.]|jgi:predicted DNA repair protein MutK|uniref:DUF808 domain-containing protein n=1 Tax=Propioniciclava sp. TaxID=2038686 RepID=UPI002C2ED42C|nr:DUF808 domain-containing protein [Propioniciclava sp.]HRL48648.1 DUF808 domain-containing protein [Propioniciclava sp.]HRL79750.1 DUF808 domain-containing protein [Propioniciclava sp.]
MSGGLAALLDDIAAMAKVAAASVDDVAAAAGRASAKAAGVVIDDAAVTPRYVTGFSPARELPMIKNIALGSLRNKLVFILPAILLLSEFLPWLLTPLLMVGGLYLSYEGAEKLWEKVSGHVPAAKTDPVAAAGTDHEKVMTAGAIRTDFILSAEIMVIALNEVTHEPLGWRAAILVVVGLLITVGVYGVVALIVKMDDIGLTLARGDGLRARFGEGLVKAMPTVLAVLSNVGMIAMLWVGGHILLVGVDELGWHAPYTFVHHLEEVIGHATGMFGGFLSWLTNTFFSFLIGLAVGALVVVVMHLIPRRAASAH